MAEFAKLYLGDQPINVDISQNTLNERLRLFRDHVDDLQADRDFPVTIDTNVSSGVSNHILRNAGDSGFYGVFSDFDSSPQNLPSGNLRNSNDSPFTNDASVSAGTGDYGSAIRANAMLCTLKSSLVPPLIIGKLGSTRTTSLIYSGQGTLDVATLTTDATQFVMRGLGHRYPGNDGGTEATEETPPFTGMVAGQSEPNIAKGVTFYTENLGTIAIYNYGDLYRINVPRWRSTFNFRYNSIINSPFQNRYFHLDVKQAYFLKNGVSTKYWFWALSGYGHVSDEVSPSFQLSYWYRSRLHEAALGDNDDPDNEIAGPWNVKNWYFMDFNYTANDFSSEASENINDYYPTPTYPNGYLTNFANYDFNYDPTFFSSSDDSPIPVEVNIGSIVHRIHRRKMNVTFNFTIEKSNNLISTSVSSNRFDINYSDFVNGQFEKAAGKLSASFRYNNANDTIVRYTLNSVTINSITETFETDLGTATKTLNFNKTLEYTDKKQFEVLIDNSTS